MNFVRSLNPCRQWQSSYINTHYFTLGFPAFQMGLDQAKQQGTLSVQMAISLYSSYNKSGNADMRIVPDGSSGIFLGSFWYLKMKRVHWPLGGYF